MIYSYSEVSSVRNRDYKNRFKNIMPMLKVIQEVERDRKKLNNTTSQMALVCAPYPKEKTLAEKIQDLKNQIFLLDMKDRWDADDYATSRKWRQELKDLEILKG